MKIFQQLYIAVLCCLSILLFSCSKKQSSTDNKLLPVDLKEIVQTDTLRIATMYGPTSYFRFREEMMGFDYEMAQNLAAHLRINLKISIASSENELFEWLRNKKVDLVCYNIIETKRLKNEFTFVPPQSEEYQVLVQGNSAKAITSVTELDGDSVCVRPNSIFHERLQALNEEIGGTIRIITMPDSISNNELIDMVAENKIKYTLAYHDMASAFKTYYNELDCRLPVGFDQRNGWLIRKESSNLQRAIDSWAQADEIVQMQSELRKKYWLRSPYFALKRITIPKGALSPYDRFFRKYAKLINWDWHLLAAVAFHESRFDATEVSWAGASGLMQLMPRTAANFGLNRQTVFNPEKNIEAGVQYIKSLNMAFRRVHSDSERIKFILAAYNSGPAHVLDAMALAQKYGKNPGVWFNHVEFFLLKKSEPKFYNDPVVKYGYFGGKTTIRYVRNALSTYEKYKIRYK